MTAVPGGDVAVEAKTGRGCLVLVVGPSGAGKDSILDGARQALAGDDRFAFVRREITRAANAGGEDHVAVSLDDFRTRAGDGTYALSWEVNGFGYGVPAEALQGLDAGQTAIVNVSRGILSAARSRFSPLCVVHVSVPAQILAQRLNGRGRETPDEIARRLDRAEAFQVDGGDVLTLVNDGSLERSVDTFVEILRIASLPKG
jgi:phosphonate metabolism protein PhnN/1,5-bisphosphokinase (PRPP-forming)